TPAGGGLNLGTTYQVDDLGRVTLQVNPNHAHDSIITVYNDPNHDVRIYHSSTNVANTTFGPTQDVRIDYPGSYIETLTTADPPNFTNGLPNGTESFTAANLQTLSRQYISAGG